MGDFELSSQFSDHTKPTSPGVSVYKAISDMYGGDVAIIKVGSVQIPINAISLIYGDMNLSMPVLKSVIKAHDDVLSYGLSNIDKEKVIAVDVNTGDWIVDELGVTGRVDWALPEHYMGEVITIHNHPGNKSLSPDDFYTVGRTDCIKSSSAQAHDGTIFNITRTDDSTETSSIEDMTQDLLRAMRDSHTAGHGFEPGIENFVKTTADKFGYIYKRS